MLPNRWYSRFCRTILILNRIHFTTNFTLVLFFFYFKKGVLLVSIEMSKFLNKFDDVLNMIAAFVSERLHRGDQGGEYAKDRVSFEIQGPTAEDQFTPAGEIHRYSQ